MREAVIHETKLGATVGVWVNWSPATPIIVCTVPPEREKVPESVVQLQVPRFASGAQQNLLLPQAISRPLLSFTGSSATD
jgi:hypothetical protein